MSKEKRGFTLVEVSTAAIIIGIVGWIGLVNFWAAKDKKYRLENFSKMKAAFPEDLKLARNTNEHDAKVLGAVEEFLAELKEINNSKEGVPYTKKINLLTEIVGMQIALGEIPKYQIVITHPGSFSHPNLPSRNDKYPLPPGMTYYDLDEERKKVYQKLGYDDHSYGQAQEKELGSRLISSSYGSWYNDYFSHGNDDWADYTLRKLIASMGEPDIDDREAVESYGYTRGNLEDILSYIPELHKEQGVKFNNNERARALSLSLEYEANKLFFGDRLPKLPDFSPAGAGQIQAPQVPNDGRGQRGKTPNDGKGQRGTMPQPPQPM